LFNSYDVPATLSSDYLAAVATEVAINGFDAHYFSIFIFICEFAARRYVRTVRTVCCNCVLKDFIGMCNGISRRSSRSNTSILVKIRSESYMELEEVELFIYRRERSGESYLGPSVL
jgi:hypothetical protein